MHRHQMLKIYQHVLNPLAPFRPLLLLYYFTRTDKNISYLELLLFDWIRQFHLRIVFKVQHVEDVVTEVVKL